MVERNSPLFSRHEFIDLRWLNAVAEEIDMKFSVVLSDLYDWWVTQIRDEQMIPSYFPSS